MYKYKEVELNAWYLVIGQNTGVGSLSLLQGIFPTQGSNPCLPPCGQILYQLSHKGSPRILEWVAYAFSRVSSQPRNWTGVSCITGRFSTNGVIRKALVIWRLIQKMAVSWMLLLRGPRKKAEKGARRRLQFFFLEKSCRTIWFLKPHEYIYI